MSIKHAVGLVDEEQRYMESLHDRSDRKVTPINDKTTETGYLDLMARNQILGLIDEETRLKN
jgi:hypothetical protein